MTTKAKKTFQNKVFMVAAPGDPTVPIAELLDINPPKTSRGTIDATTHDSAGGAEEVISEGTYDPGEMTVQMNYIAGSDADTLFIGSAVTGELQNVKLHTKSATGWQVWSYSGFVTEYGPDAFPVKGKQTASATFKVSGPVTRAALQ